MRSKCATSLLCSPPYFNNCLSLQQFVRRSSGASKAFSTRSAGCRSWTRRSGTSASRRSSRRRRDQRRRRPQVRRPKTPSPTPPPRPSSTLTSRTPERLSWKNFLSLGIISSRLFRYKFWTPLLFKILVVRIASRCMACSSRSWATMRPKSNLRLFTVKLLFCNSILRLYDSPILEIFRFSQPPLLPSKSVDQLLDVLFYFQPRSDN